VKEETREDVTAVVLVTLLFINLVMLWLAIVLLVFGLAGVL